MSTLASRIVEVQTALDSLARQHKVPGASLGIMDGDELVELVTGVANMNTGVPVTTDTLFQIGSNTKVYTATLVMQLVDEGLIDLDAPVRKYIPELQLADKSALPKITVRMLLTHQSGIEGDYFEDFGRGDDGIEKYVDSFKTLGNIYPPGEMWSYCNSGWVLLGRLVEVVRGKNYHEVLREKLLAPVGANMTTVLMEEMLARVCAVGHVMPPGLTKPIVPPQVMMSPSASPAGSMTSSTPAEVFKFVRMHLDNGRAPDGSQVLSVKSAKAMQQAQCKLPQSGLGGEMGLGWILSDWEGERVIGHGGGTIGQLSFLQVLPDRRFGVVLLTNSGTGGALWRDLSRYIYEEFTGVHTPQLPKAPELAPKLDLTLYEGKYTRLGIDIELKVTDGKLLATMQGTGPLAAMSPPQTAVCRAIDKELFVGTVQGQDVLAQFIDFDRGGRPGYMHLGGRVSRRVGGGTTTTATSRPKAKATRTKPKAKATRTAARKKAPAKKRARR